MRLPAALFALAAGLLPSLGGIAGGAQPEREESAAADRAAEERYARERDAARRWVRTRTEQAHRAMASRMRVAGALAEMLVPNVAPVPIVRDRRGMPLEIDLAQGEESAADWLAGTPHAGRLDLAEFTRAWRGETFGPTCNAELRGRFADRVERRLSPAERREAYLFLAARTRAWTGYPEPLAPVAHRSDGAPVVTRLTVFEGRGRRPPLGWSTENHLFGEQIRAWAASSGTGRKLRRVMDDFWRETAPLLGSPERLCPRAAARRAEIQARIVAGLPPGGGASHGAPPR
ncbi:MAG TPA: hypothetical protein VF552_16535 [Allosphingosinicella sp.]|jgi:hypothetical protein